MYVCEETVIAEYVHRALVFKKDPVWIKASRVIIHVVRYLVKARAWSGLGVVAVFIVGLGVVFCLSVACLLRG